MSAILKRRRRERAAALKAEEGAPTEDSSPVQTADEPVEAEESVDESPAVAEEPTKTTPVGGLRSLFKPSHGGEKMENE